MKKVLQINSVVNTTSTGKIAEGIGLTAKQNGWESYIAYGRRAGESESKIIRIGNDLDQKFHAIQTRLFDNHGLASKESTRKFLRVIDEIAPNIIHLHNVHGYYLNYEILFSYLSEKKIPIVWTLHDCWTFTGHCAYFDMANCDCWKNGCLKCDFKYLYPKSILLNKSKENYKKKKYSFLSIEDFVLVPVSKWLGGLLNESFFCNCKKEVIHNGIDLDIFSPVGFDDIYKMRHSLGIEDGDVILLGVANLFGERKGFSEFIKLSDALPRGYKLIMVGVQKADRQKLPSNIIGIERTENTHQLAVIYSMANFFLNLTLEDNYPTTNLEAIACGTPVITYNTGGSPESISKSTGYVVKKGNLNSVLEIVNNENNIRKREYYREECRNYAVCYFDRFSCFDKYIDLYNRILHKNI